MARCELVRVAESSFTALCWRPSRRGVIRITRLRLDAALYEPAPARPPGTKGPPCPGASACPSLPLGLAAAATRWRTIRVLGWYGHRDRVIEFCSATAAWRHAV